MVRFALVRLALAIAPCAPLLLCACPQQELAPITPCTVSGASIDAAQTGVDKVDLLFVIDNSGSMSEEQVKLSQQLPKLVRVLATGDRDGVPNADGQPDFTPVKSLHLGVVSSDLGVNGQTEVRSCGDQSFKPSEQDTDAPENFYNKPRGDEGKLLHSPEVAVAGVNIQVNREPVRAIQPVPSCAGVNVNRFLEFERDKSDVDQVAHQFGCIAELGVNGCGYEQQLESMWRALAPSTNASFSGMSTGQGGPSGYNKGFLRDDAVLVVILVSDEEDCSSPDASRDVLYRASDPARNVLCARNPGALHPVSRYLEGLKSLKPMYPDRIIFAGIVGVPLASATSAKTPDEILALPEMQAVEEEVSDVLGLRPACISANNSGDADPARRMVELAKGFGPNGVITSICENDYGPALAKVIEKIAEKLSGACLPRQLKVNAKGLVECLVVEIKAANDTTPCAATPGRERELPPRVVGGSQRVVCEVTQLPVVGQQVPQGVGWYYDNFSAALMKTCKTDRQRVAFAAGSPLSQGALARVECQQSVLNAEVGAVGVDAVDTPCSDDGSGAPHGDAKCQTLSLPGQALLCTQGTCQLSCSVDADCQPGFVCAEVQGRGFCTNPTCPISESDPQGADATVPAGP
jgi:hypothetical protein